MFFLHALSPLPAFCPRFAIIFCEDAGIAVCDKPGLLLTDNGQALCGAFLQEAGRLQRRCIARHSAVLSLALQ